ncbi:uncharacterized protein SCDLUD_002448 [Saccharomycodes ludwigii]|uniref:uncharacterized protein n=1 Tax=Saccharomycodes ludwigii TaxID=36035 RepID=UPI001E85BCAC|nr:hypothetical protein SCDLUD_002448 [Saccharomycodes ludwigii]KAH3900984.1 hypothetical protein SCDLUD_002448 [Saccharomycodes ludwigii]
MYILNYLPLKYEVNTTNNNNRNSLVKNVKNTTFTSNNYSATLQLERESIINHLKSYSPDTNSSSDIFNTIDILLNFSNDLLSSGNNTKNSDLLNTLLLLAKSYHQQAYNLLFNAYSSTINTTVPPNHNCNNSWQRSTYYIKLSLGLLTYINQEYNCFAPSNQNSMMVIKFMFDYNTIYQQYTVILLSLYKLKDSLIENYSQDNLQKSTEGNGLSFQMLAKLCIGCYNNTLELINLPSLPLKIVNFLKILANDYFYGLIELLLALQKFEIENKIGESVSLINDSISVFEKSSVFQKILFSKKKGLDGLSTVTSTLFNSGTNNNNYNTKLFKSKLKLSNLKDRISTKVQNNNNNTVVTNTNSISKTYFDMFPDTLILNTFTLFISELLYLLQYRFSNYNNTISFDLVTNDKQQLRKLWPTGKKPQSVSIQWVYKNGVGLGPIDNINEKKYFF